jgi:hypothetical protein
MDFNDLITTFTIPIKRAERELNKTPIMKVAPV